MKLSDFCFDLPPELIASYPLPERDASRLMVIDGENSSYQHCQFSQVLDLVVPGDLLIFNNTKVIPARFYGQKVTGGKVEVLIEKILNPATILCQLKVSKAPLVGSELLFAQNYRLKVLGRQGQFYQLGCINADQTIWDIMQAIGEIPLPHYMQRSPEALDKERYQTVYAEHQGSVAAPTAGLHFTQALLNKLTAKGVGIDFLTLHIGAGTFAPVRVDDIRQHQMHAEFIDVSEALCRRINVTKRNGGRIIAVGTTSLRSLESAAQSGVIQAMQGETDIFIYPGFQFNCVDALITNLHLPGSTLMMLVSAFGGYSTMRRAYELAVQEKYRFFSYGDAMFIKRCDQHCV